ncbi:EamA family transporter, partial [Halomonas sp. BBD48]|nr:EamA family transporter [Halomonas sp. BBD48]
MTQDQRAMLYGVGAVGLWSTVATAFKLALETMSPVELMWIAALVSWLLIGALVWRRNQLGL